MSGRSVLVVWSAVCSLRNSSKLRSKDLLLATYLELLEEDGHGGAVRRRDAVQDDRLVGGGGHGE